MSDSLWTTERRQKLLACVDAAGQYDAKKASKAFPNKTPQNLERRFREFRDNPIYTPLTLATPPMVQLREPRILLYDLETSPFIGYTWGKYEQDVIEFIEYGHILCFAYKWLGDKTTTNVALPDFKLYSTEPKNDYEVVRVLHNLFEEADIVIAHNGDNFDQKYTNSRFIFHGFNPPEAYKQVDTLKLARKYAKFPSNKLNDLGDYLNIGHKAQTGGFATWKGCLEGDPKAWKTMIAYNNQDVELLERVYLKLRPWADNHPPLNTISNVADACPKCGVKGSMQRRGYSANKVTVVQRYQCKACGGWSRSRVLEKVPVAYVN